MEFEEKAREAGEIEMQRKKEACERAATEVLIAHVRE